MTKKILLLVLFLPMIIMISLFTTTDVVSLSISIPVTGIEIVEENIVYLDLDEEETYKIDYTVYPTNASNNEVALSTEKIGDARLATFDFKDGYLIPKTIGMAKVYLSTIDGGYKDSFVVQVDSNMLQEINCEISADEIHVGKNAVITTVYIPANAKNQVVSYESSNENVAIVDNRGNVTGVGRGTATIKIYSPDNNEIFDEVSITVINTDVMDLSISSAITWDKTGSFNASIDCDIDYELSYRVLDQALNPITTSDLTVTFGTEDEAGNVAVNYEFAEKFIGELNLEVKIKTSLGYELARTVNLKRVDKITVEFDYSEAPVFTKGTTNMMFINLKPSNADVRYEVSASNDNIAVSEMNGVVILNALKAGTAVVNVKAYVEGVSEAVTCSQEVIISPNKFNINEISKTYGIEGTWTVAGKNYDNASKEFKDAKYKVNLSYGKDEEVADNFLSYVSYEVVDKNGKELKALSIDTEGNFKVNDFAYVGEAYIRAIFKVDDKKIKTSEPLKVLVVGDGVNADSYEDLLAITKQDLTLVLADDINDFGLYEDKTKMPVAETYTEIFTTYDWTHYKNLGYEQPKVKVLVTFDNDVYGNGYTINAHNIAYGLDQTDSLSSNALFRGPLNFVGITDSGVGAISVKAQDNICFAVYENVTVSNVELKGCDLKADSNNNIDLTDLNYTGTVVEVLGDNVTIECSRITNGRTGLRVFGDINNPDKVINLNISNSILRGAREFLIRMGSNKFIDGGRDVENCAPYIPGSEEMAFPIYPSYAKMYSTQKSAYDQKYIKTFVTVKNTAFKDCGIFSVGVDSHFAGPLLADGSSDDILGGRLKEIVGDSWHDLAKTSYGAKLIFDGDVRIYDWKKLDSVDSTTLIEILKLNGAGNNLFNKMEFKVNEMVDKISQDPRYLSIIYSDPSFDGGSKYVHGGVAFFGGGKNYGVFEQVNADKTFASLNGYQVTLADCGRAELEMAAGSNPFYFLMHDSTTINFTPKTQQQMFESGSNEDPYSFVYEK